LVINNFWAGRKELPTLSFPYFFFSKSNDPDPALYLSLSKESGVSEGGLA